jgi:PTS system cellobiose-specific IIB component
MSEMLIITLLCNLGMSTGMLIDKIKEAAEAKGIEVDVDAAPFDKAGDRLDRTDILLLGPQVRYHMPRFQKDYGGKIPVIDTIDFTDYALVNGQKILNEALAKLPK